MLPALQASSSIGARLRLGEIPRHSRPLTVSKETKSATLALSRKRPLESAPQSSPKAVARKEEMDVRIGHILTQSQIIETKVFADIKKHIKPRSLVLLDVDNTLMETQQTLGSDQWFRWRIEYYKRNGYQPGPALETALMEWVSVQCITQVKLVEKGTDRVVKYMQDEGFTVMGLTTRGASLATRTVQQLHTIDISLERNAPASAKEVVFLNPHEVIYKNGILFTSGTHKGQALLKFLDLIKEEFSQDAFDDVVFINDRKSDLEQIQESCQERGIPFVGLRYGYVDEKVRQFPEDIALLQFEQFGKILSDEEAQQQLK